MKRLIALRQPRIPNGQLAARTSRLLVIVGTAIVATGCQGGTITPLAPSSIGAQLPLVFTADAPVANDAVIGVRGAPVSYEMNMVNASGYSGTCTISDRHAGGFRLKAQGQGLPDSRIRFNLVNVSSSTLFRTTAIVDVNQQGMFRTGWDVWGSTTFPADASLECWLTELDDSDAILARSNAISGW